MKKKSIRRNKNRVTRSKKRTGGKTTIRRKTATRSRMTITKAAVKPEDIRSNAGALGGLPEVTETDGESVVDVIEVLEVGVVSIQDDIPTADESEVVPEETEGKVVRRTES
jgi:hypothetical protein